MNSDLLYWISSCLIIFLIGLYGLVSKKEGLKLIISIELMVSAANAVFIGIGYLASPKNNQVDPLAQSYAILSLAVGGAIIGIALSMLTIVYKKHGTIDISKLNQLRW